jgi:diguanylate cyclase (GGDEF)-like protein
MNQKILNVLLIDDDEEEHFITLRLLNSVKNVKYHLKSVYDYKTGLTEILSNQYNVCLIDFRLGSEDGLSLVRESIDKGCLTPLILLTGHGDISIDLNAMEAGAMDYLNKGEINSQMLERVIRYAIERKKNENQLIKINQQLQYLATYDVLTGVLNRNHFNHQLPLIVEQCIRNKQSIGIIFLDLDQFKQINDTLGHSYGDLLLQQVVKRLKDNLRKVDNIFRLGGDEFIIVVDGAINKKKMSILALKIIKLLSKPFKLNDEHICQISASLGITLGSFKNMPSPEQLTKEADIAMYSAKNSGRNNFKIFSHKLTKDIQ